MTKAEASLLKRQLHTRGWRVKASPGQPNFWEVRLGPFTLYTGGSGQIVAMLMAREAGELIYSDITVGTEPNGLWLQLLADFERQAKTETERRLAAVYRVKALRLK